MGVGKGRKGIVVDRGERAAAMCKIETKSLARVEGAVGLLALDGLGQFGVVKGQSRIVLAVGGVAGQPDIVEREIVDLLQRAFVRLQADKFHARDVFADSRVLKQGHEPRR